LFLVTRFITSWIPFGNQIQDLQLRYSIPILILLAAVVVVTTLFAARRIYKGFDRSRLDGNFQAFGLGALWVAVYLVVYTADWLINTVTDPVTNRLMLPVYVGLVICLGAAIASWQNAWFRGRLRWFKLIFWVIPILAVIIYSDVTVRAVIIPLQPGQGYTAFAWKNSETLAAVRDLPEGLPIASIEDLNITLWTDRPAYLLQQWGPSQFSFNSEVFNTIANENISSETAQSMDIIRKEGVAMVFFDTIQFKSPVNADIGTGLNTFFGGGVVCQKYPDGMICLYSPK
jgi:hypothetical protein